MGLFSSLVAFLEAQSDITDLVGSGTAARIRPNKLKQGEALPALRLAVAGGETVEALDGRTDTEIVDLQVDCYADSPKEAEALRVAVRDSLLGYQGTMGDVFINGIANMTFNWDFEEPVDASDKGAHRVLVQFNVVYTE